MGQSNWVHLENCEIVAETEKAFHVRWNGATYWLPKSQIADAEVYEKGDRGVTLSITEWIAQEKEIEVDE